MSTMQAWGHRSGGAKPRPPVPPPDARRKNGQRLILHQHRNRAPHICGRRTCAHAPPKPRASRRHLAPKTQSRAAGSRQKNVYPFGETAPTSDKTSPNPTRNQPRHRRHRPEPFPAPQRKRSAPAARSPDTSPPKSVRAAAVAMPQEPRLKRRAKVYAATANRSAGSSYAWNQTQCRSIAKTRYACQFQRRRCACLQSSDIARSGQWNL